MGFEAETSFDGANMEMDIAVKAVIINFFIMLRNGFEMKED